MLGRTRSLPKRRCLGMLPPECAPALPACFHRPLWAALCQGSCWPPRLATQSPSDRPRRRSTARTWPCSGRRPFRPTPPRIDVYTIGPGDYFFSLFGHAAICVIDDQSPPAAATTGARRTSTLLGLAWQVVRGRAQFWVGVMDLPRMLNIYMGEDRTLYRQRLPLSPTTAARLVERLHRVDRRSESLYTYHNIHDNCTTRIRDLINEVSADGGSAPLATPALKVVDQPSFRSAFLARALPAARTSWAVHCCCSVAPSTHRRAATPICSCRASCAKSWQSSFTSSPS